MNHHSRGFTLLEVMVALALFAILATITTFALRQAFDIQKRVTVQSNRLKELQMALILINRDTKQIVLRRVRSAHMRLLPVFIGTSSHVEFTRDGLVNPMGTALQSTLQHVALFCKNGQLLRRVFKVLDSPSANNYYDTLLIDNLSSCTFSYMNKTKAVTPTWAPHQQENSNNDSNDEIPTAIQLSMTLKDWGMMNLWYNLPERAYNE